MTTPETPFDTVENAHEYIHLLMEAVAEAKRDIAADLAAVEARPDRRVEALRLVQYKLERLEQQLKGTGRNLNDLRSLRRLLLEERYEPLGVAVSAGSGR